MPYQTDKQYRSLDLLLPTADKLIDSDNYIEGYAATFDKPYPLYEYAGQKYYEVITQEALLDADLTDVIMQYDHTGKVLARQSNGTLLLKNDGYGLKIAADLSKSQAARELYQEITSGLITKMSWGFTVNKQTYDKETRTNTISSIKKVYDVSAVSFPANTATEISARCYLNAVIEAEKQQAQEHKLALTKAKYYYLGGIN